MNKSIIPIIIGIIIIPSILYIGCATFSVNYKLGYQATINKDWDNAVKYFEKALAENPDNSIYRIALLRAKIEACNFHLIQARRKAYLGQKEEALKEYQKALSYDPLNGMILNEIRELREGGSNKERVKSERIEFPVKLDVRDEKINLKFTNTNLSSIFRALGKHAGANVLFDEQFKDMIFSFSLEEMTFKRALNSLCLASKNFYRVIDEKTLIIVPDNAMKRRQYEINGVKTFYLSNIKAEDIQRSLSQMLRTQYRAPFIVIDKNLNSITLRDTPANLNLAEKMISNWDKARGEVVIDLEIMEVSRTKLRQYGLDFDSYLVGGKYALIEEDEGSNSSSQTSGWISLADLDLSKKSNYFLTLPISFIKFLESDADTKIITQPRLRGIEGEEISYVVGEKIPIPQTTFTPIAAGGVSQQPITSFIYEDVGITLKITPRIHFEREVTLELDIKVTSLGGTGYAGIPIIGTREVKNVIRLKEGETNLLAGLLKDEERKSLKGIVGLKNLPILGHLFSNTDQTITQTDVVLTITPYIIRSVSIKKEDLEPLWIGVEEKISSGEISPSLPEEEKVIFGRQREVQRLEREEIRENEIIVSPSRFSVPPERQFFVNVIVRTTQEVSNISLNLNFDSRVLEIKNISPGNFMTRLGAKVPFLKNIDNNSGVATIGFTSPEITKGSKGEGILARVTFQAKEKGESSISLSGVNANNPRGGSITFATKDGEVKVE
ncbi:MAG: cohesin domain-containing protein [Candidatus Aminicenantia bacterium]